MEIHIKTLMTLTGITANDAFISDRNVRRKQERKLRKKLGDKLTKKEISDIAKVHPVGCVEIINLS
jgi:hypothetical protein